MQTQIQTKVSSLSFPKILKIFQLKYFDFSKVIESVVRHDKTLPRSVKAHLRVLAYVCLTFNFLHYINGVFISIKMVCCVGGFVCLFVCVCFGSGSVIDVMLL